MKNDRNRDMPENRKSEHSRSEYSGSKRNGLLRKTLRFVFSLALLLLMLFAGVMEFLTLTEYRPEERERASVEPGGRELIGAGDSFTVVTWNCGYGALGEDADFFMDGGKSVNTADKETVRLNIAKIADALAQMRPNVIFLQEVDRDSDRSHGIEEVIELSNTLQQDYDMSYTSASAYNLNVRFVPFPIPPIGKVKSGLVTFSDALARDAERIQLPVPFKWPVRPANFKRCLLVERLPLQNVDRELVLINLHLEAFDDGKGKEEQTRMLREILKEEAASGNYVIAGGDFNQTFSNTDISAYPLQEGVWAPGRIDTSEFSEGWQCLMDPDVPTCRSLDRPYAGADKDAFQYYVIDGFIVSSNIEVQSVETRDLGFVNADHNPVLMECVLK